MGIKLAVRAIESFLFVVISAFLSQIVLVGHPINLAEPDSQSHIVTAFLAAVGIAVRQYAVTRNNT